MGKYRRAVRSGFVLYHDLADDFYDMEDEEAGKIIKAAMMYSKYGLLPDEFPDRAVRSLWRKVKQNVESSIESYSKKAIDNTYKRYLGTEKKAGREPLSQEEWYYQIYDASPGSVEQDNSQPQSRTVDHSQPQSNTVDNIDNESESENDIEIDSEREPERDVRGNIPNNQGTAPDSSRSDKQYASTTECVSKNDVICYLLKGHNIKLERCNAIYEEMRRKKQLNENWKQNADHYIPGGGV